MCDVFCTKYFQTVLYFVVKTKDISQQNMPDILDVWFIIKPALKGKVYS
jgi:hypothetical protein